MATVMGDDSVTSPVLENVEAKQRKDVLFAEDVAWADSCLIKDPPEISETNLDSLKDALLDILTCHSESLVSSAAERDGLPGGIVEKGASEKIDIVVDDAISTIETTESNSDDHPLEENPDTLFSRSYLEKSFLPTYNDELREIHYSDSDEEFILPKFMMEPSSTEDIFKVWDLDIPVEEDELVKQLSKALSESSSKTTFNDSEVEKGLKEVLLDDLVNGIADLSLKQNPG